MAQFRFVSASIAILWSAALAQGTTITVEALQRDPGALASQGIQVDPTGPRSMSEGDAGAWEVLGSTIPFLDHDRMSSYLTGSATFASPMDVVTLEVRSVSASALNAGFTLVGYEQGHEVASNIVRLEGLGNVSHITLSATAIDQITWSGSGLVFRPYLVEDFHFQPAASASKAPVPLVGASSPEPASAGILAFSSALLLLSRRR